VKEANEIDTWFTWYPSAGLHQQTIPMIFSGTKLKHIFALANHTNDFAGVKVKTYLTPTMDDPLISLDSYLACTPLIMFTHDFDTFHVSSFYCGFLLPEKYILFDRIKKCFSF